MRVATPSKALKLIRSCFQGTDNDNDNANGTEPTDEAVELPGESAKVAEHLTLAAPTHSSYGGLSLLQKGIFLAVMLSVVAFFVRNRKKSVVIEKSLA